MKNYYSVLGVTPDSTEAEIKSAYRALVRKFHPDINPDGEEIFKDISEAYQTLSDAQKRMQYDTINGFFKTKQSEPKFTSAKKASDEYKKSDIKEKNTKKQNNKFNQNINRIFDEFNKKDKPEKGLDIHEEVIITLKEAINGTEKTINIISSSLCSHCKGKKFINGNKCNICNGTGEEQTKRKIRVKIPANINNGTKLKLKNEGAPGKNGGVNGDLYIKILIKENSKIKFDEAGNTLLELPITPFEAVLGGDVLIPGLNGNISLKLPPKTKNGQKFRLSGQGLCQKNKSTDLIINIHIEIDSYLSDDEIKLYEKLKKLSSKNIRENLLNE